MDEEAEGRAGKAEGADGVEGAVIAGREEDEGVGVVMEGRVEREGVGMVGVVMLGRVVRLEGSEGAVGVEAEVGEGRTRLAKLVKGVGLVEGDDGSREGREDEVEGVETVVGSVGRVEVGEGVDS